MKSFSFKKRAIGIALTCIIASFDLQAGTATQMYVANGGSFDPGHVTIIDVDTQQVLTSLTGGTSAFGVAFDGRTGMYLSNGNASNVNIFDVRTQQVVGTVGVGNSPRGIAFDGVTGMYVANFISDTVTVINRDTLQAVNSINTVPREGPFALALDGGTGMYVTTSDTNNVTIINTDTKLVVGSIGVGITPQSIAFDGVTGMYVVNRGALSENVNVINTETQVVGGTITFGVSKPQSVAFDGVTGMYIGTQDDEVQVINTQTLAVVNTITVTSSGRLSHAAFNGVTGMYFSNSFGSSNVFIIDTSTKQHVDTISVLSSSAQGIAFAEFTVPTSVTVTTNSDGIGAGTLRDAIAQMNVGGGTVGMSFTGGLALISLGSDLPAFTVSDISVDGATATPQGISGSKAFSFPGTATLSNVDFFSTAMGNSGTLSLSNVSFDASTVENVGQLLVPANQGLTCINSSITGSGVVSLSGGILSASGGVNLEQSLNIVSSSTAAVSPGGTLTLAQGLSGTGQLSKTLSGVLSLSGTSETHTGDLLVQAGDLLLNNGLSGGGNLTMQGGTLASSTPGTFTISRSVDFSSDANVSVPAGATLAFSGTAVLGTGNLTKTGSGILSLATDTSALTGSILVQGGTLSVGATLGGTGSLSMQGGNLSTATPGTFTISRPAAFSSDAEVSVPAGATLSFSTSITGPGTLTKTNVGRLIIDAGATALGAVVVDDGILQLDNNNSLPAGTGTLSVNTSGRVDVNASVSTGNVSSTGTIQIATGAVLTSSVTGSTTLAGTASGLGFLAKAGSGQWDFTADTSALTGSILVQGGTLSVGATLAGTGALSMTGGNLSTATPGSFTILRPADFSSDASVDVPLGATLSFSTLIAGPGALTKTSPGSLSIDSGATSLGAIVVDSGLLQLNNDNALPAGTGSLSTNTSGVVDINASVSTGNVSGSGTIQIVGASNSLTASISGSASLGGTVAGLGALAKSGTGTWFFTADTSGLTGPFSVNAGILRIGSDLLGSGNLIFQGGNLASFGTEISSPIILLSDTDIDVATGSELIFSGGLSGPGNLTKIGGGVLSLTGDTSFHSGSLLISDGALNLNSSVTGGGNLTFQGGSLSASQTLEASRPILFSSNGTVDVLDLKTLTFSGTVSGSNLLTKTGLGTLIISGDGTSLGAVAVNEGTFQVDGTASLPAAPGTVAIGNFSTLNVNASVSTGDVSGSGTVLINSGNTLTTQVSGSVALAGTVTGEGTFTKGGTGTLTLSGNVIELDTLRLTNGLVEVNSIKSLPLTAAAGTGSIIVEAPSTLKINQSMQMGALSGPGTLCIPTGVNVSTLDATFFSGSVTCGGSLDTGCDPNDLDCDIIILNGTFTTPDKRRGSITLLPGTNLEVGAGFMLFSDIIASGTVGLIVPPSEPALLQGDFDGEDIEKRGEGIAVFDMGTTVTIDDLTISEGTIKVNTEACITDLVIPAGGVLRGIGTIGVSPSCVTASTVLSQGGEVFPGTSIGTLTIKDTYTAEANSTHTFEVSPTANSKLVIEGLVVLGDSVTADILTELEFYQLPFSFNVIESTLPIIGTISGGSVSNPFLVVSFSKSLNPGHFITATLNSAPLAPFFEGKEGAVAKCIDEIASQLDCNTNTAASALATLTSVSAVGEALLQLQPSALTSLSVLQENHLLYLSSAVDLHLDGPSTRKTEPRYQWNIWATGLGGHTDQDNSSRDVGFRANSGGMVIGADTLLGKHSSAGTLIGYTNGHLRWRDGRGKADTHTVYAGGYGRFATQRVFVNAALFYGYSFYDVERKIRFGNFQPLKETAKSDFQGMEGSAHVQIGLDYQCARFGFLPFVEADYMVIHQNKFKEHNAGALNLKVGSHLADLLSAAAGLKIDYRKIKADHRLVPFVGVKIIHEERFFGDTEEGAFVCGCSMGDLKGLYPSRTLFGVQAGMDAVFLERHTLSLQYQGKFGHRYSDQSGYLEYSCRL